MRVLPGPAVVLLLVVSLSSAQETCPPDGGTCRENPMAIKKTTTTDPSAHYYIGGLFGIHEKGPTAYSCSDKFRLRGVMNLQAFLWAINYFQSRLTADGNRVSIGGVAFDNCQRKEQTVENIMGFEQCRNRLTGVDRRQVLAFVGPDTSSEALAAAALLKDMSLTTVSHAATSPELSDGNMYPYFLRTVPSDANDAAILAGILAKELGAKYTQLIYMDNSYGKHGMEEFKKHAKANGICIVQSIMVSSDVSTSADSDVLRKLINKQNVKYVVLFTDGPTANRVLQSSQAYISRSSQNSVQFIFLGTSSWGNSELYLNNAYSAANNSIVVSLSTDPLYTNAINAFKNYWYDLKPNNSTSGIDNKYLTKYWEERFNCEVDGTSNACVLATQSLRDELDVYVPYTIMAVDAIIRGVYNAATKACNIYDLCSDLLNIGNRGTAIFRGIKQAEALGEGGRVLFDQSVGANNKYVTGDPSSGNGGFSNYKVYSVVKGSYIEFGNINYKAGANLTRTRGLDMRFYQNKDVCNYPCTDCGEVSTTQAPTTAMTTAPTATSTKDPTEGGNFTFVKFPTSQELTGAYFKSPRNGEMWMTRFEIGQRWIIALGVLAGLGILAVIIFEIYILYKLLGTRMGSRWRTMWLGQLLLFGIFLSFLTLFAFIPVPTKATCALTRFGVGVSYSIMFAVLLVKLMVILTSKTSEASLLPGDIESPNYLKGIYQFLMFMFAVGVQVVIDAQWLITVPPEAVLVTDNGGNQAWVCNHYTWKVNTGMLNMTTFVRNDFENHLLSLVYIMFLILITTVLALNAHGIITNHRESIFIGIAAGFSIPIWLSWGLVGGLNRDHVVAQEFGDACIAFGLFLTATLILFAMFLPKVRQLVNIGVEGIYFEDDRETYYAGSVIMSPPSYKSKANSVLYVNNSGIYSEPVVVGNGDPMATHLKHPGHHSGPYSTYSAPAGYTKKSEAGSKVLRVTPDLTGKHPTERRRPQSEFAYAPRSVKGTLKRPRSTQNLGAL
ncbi:metabotropic glutamate receptor 3-like [Haliotis cracherodii]|uniref:metabotropic glutamate receptor 3-like n=1 Tax=Haliotis cracherodii TaxID=6455 RepID=UPI0039E7346E